MVHVPHSAAQSCLEILHFEIRKFLQDLFGIQAGGKESENVDDANAHAACEPRPKPLSIITAT
jgi:hypothetical protein